MPSTQVRQLWRQNQMREMKRSGCDAVDMGEQQSRFLRRNEVAGDRRGTGGAALFASYAKSAHEAEAQPELESNVSFW